MYFWCCTEVNFVYTTIHILMLKLKLHYFGHLIRTADSLEKTLMLVKIEGRRRRGWQRMRWLDGTTNSMDMNLGNSGRWRGTGRLGMLQSMGSQSGTWLGNSTTTTTTTTAIHLSVLMLADIWVVFSMSSRFSTVKLLFRAESLASRRCSIKCMKSESWWLFFN